MEFIDTGEFFRGAAKLKEEEKVLPWIELPIGKIYRIERYETLESSKFDSPCYIVHHIDIANPGQSLGIEKIDKAFRTETP